MTLVSKNVLSLIDLFCGDMRKQRGIFMAVALVYLLFAENRALVPDHSAAVRGVRDLVLDDGGRLYVSFPAPRS